MLAGLRLVLMMLVFRYWSTRLLMRLGAADAWAYEVEAPRMRVYTVLEGGRSVIGSSCGTLLGQAMQLSIGLLAGKIIEGRPRLQQFRSLYRCCVQLAYIYYGYYHEKVICKLVIEREWESKRKREREREREILVSIDISWFFDKKYWHFLSKSMDDPGHIFEVTVWVPGFKPQLQLPVKWFHMAISPTILKPLKKFHHASD